MDLQSQAYSARAVGIADRTLRRWIKSGQLTKYGKQVDLDEVKKLIAFKRKDPAWVQRSKDTTEQNKRKKLRTATPNTTKETKTTTEEPKLDNFTRARIHREAYNAKMIEAKYKKAIGELVELDRVYEVVGGVVEYYNNAFDNLPITLRNKDNKITNEMVENMFREINEIKENTNKMILGLEWE